MTLAILQARVSSTRLPGKVLKSILGEPMLFRQIERIKRSRLIQTLIVATSVDPSDDALADACMKRGQAYRRGSLADVLDRFYQTALPFAPEHVVRLTGDCPLADPLVIDLVIQHHLDGGYDYTSNALEPTYPDGLDVEIVRFSCLAEAWREAVLPSQREHVLPFIHQQPNRYRLGSVVNAVDFSALRWTVDEPADFELVSHIYNALYPSNPAFSTDDILAFLKSNPELCSMNSCFMRNEGYTESLKKDAGSARKVE